MTTNWQRPHNVLCLLGMHLRCPTPHPLRQEKETLVQESKTTAPYLQETIFKTSEVKMMRSDTVIILLAFLIFGMFCHTDAVKSVSVMEGETVFLNTDVCKQHYDTMRWYFNDTLIALIHGDLNSSCLYDGEDGRFRDRLKVDYESGSLNITNTRTEHTGRYEAEIIRSESSGKTQSLNRNPKCDSTKMYKKNINPEDIIKSFSLTVTASDSGKNKNEAQIVPEDKEMQTRSGPSSGAVAGIVVGVLLLAVVAGVIYKKKQSTEPPAPTGPAVSQPLTPRSTESDSH